jgi:hypothetical protein
VTRHGNYCTIDGNYFNGDDISENIGRIRLINTGHWVTNNYFYNLKGQNFRSPLAVMNGIPKSPLNRYNQVTDVVVAHNTWGIVNGNISGNTFRNNPVKLVALLWGAKNNTHSDNEIVNSGKLVVEVNLKLKLMY